MPHMCESIGHLPFRVCCPKGECIDIQKFSSQNEEGKTKNNQCIDTQKLPPPSQMKGKCVEGVDLIIHLLGDSITLLIVG